MAFCPHCGKEAGNQATTCIACGKPLATAQKPAAGGGAMRFKGTMMMQPAANPAAAPGGGAPAPQPTAAAAPPPAASVAPAASAVPAPAAGGGPARFKGTMIGTGIPGAAVAAASAPAAAASPSTAPSAAVPSAAASGLADTAPASDAAPAIAAAKLAAEIASARPPAAAAQGEDSQRFLVGDPMAPGEGVGRHTPARSHAVQPDGDGRPSWTLVVVGFVGMLVIAGLGIGIAVYLGLLEL